MSTSTSYPSRDEKPRLVRDTRDAVRSIFSSDEGYFNDSGPAIVNVPVNTYAYQRIDEEAQIRILKILPGTKGELLRCKLLTHAMPSVRSSSSQTNPVHYRALSYTWGEPDEVADYGIAMSDHIEETNDSPFVVHEVSFYIRSNLDGALRALQRETTDVNVWVDALCINQQNIQEKTAQVARMDDIYSSAEAVCVWLGAGDGTTKRTFEFLKQILNLTELDRLVHDKEHKEDWFQVMYLLKNRWFSRRWVIQEIALARKAYVRCGSEEMDWQDFAIVIDLFQSKLSSIMATIGQPLAHNSSGIDLRLRSYAAVGLVSATSNLFHKSRDGKIKQRLLNLEVLVSSLFLQFEASEPRDIIYAALSLAKDTSGDLERKKIEKEGNPWKRILGALLEIVAHLILLLLLTVSAKSEQGRQKGRLNWDAITSRVFGSNIPNLHQINRFLLETMSSSRFRPEDCADFLESFTETCQALDIIRQYWKPGHRRRRTRSLQRYNAKGIDMRLIPDYSKSLTDVCADFMEYCIETSQSLDILCRHWAPSPKPLTYFDQVQVRQAPLPSWIPSLEKSAFGGPNETFKVRRKGDPLVGSLVRNNHQHDCDYNASSDLPPVAKFQKIKIRGSLFDPPEVFEHVLSVEGIALDTIWETSDRVLFGYIPPLVFEFLGWTQNQGLNEIPDHLWRTLVADRGQNGSSTPVWYRRACLELFTYLDGGGGLNTSDILDGSNSEAPSTVVRFVRRVQQVIWDKRFFFNNDEGKERMFGFAPGETKPGDLICVLFGCSVPVVLRKVKETGKYLFVGECYVHGMMDGEATRAKGDKLEHAGAEYRTFHIV